MRVSTKGRYGLRVMIELAQRNGGGPVMMSSIAECQGLSRKYLHSLLTNLKSAGLVRSIRGAGGGYVLAKSPQDITVADVVHALEGAFAPVDCLQDLNLCEKADLCAARDVWQEMQDAIESVLSGITLEQLAARQKEKHVEERMYYI